MAKWCLRLGLPARALVVLTEERYAITAGCGQVMRDRLCLSCAAAIQRLGFLRACALRPSTSPILRLAQMGLWHSRRALMRLTVQDTAEYGRARAAHSVWSYWRATMHPALRRIM